MMNPKKIKEGYRSRLKRQTEESIQYLLADAMSCWSIPVIYWVFTKFLVTRVSEEEFNSYISTYYNLSPDDYANNIFLLRFVYVALVRGLGHVVSFAILHLRFERAREESKPLNNRNKISHPQQTSLCQTIAWTPRKTENTVENNQADSIFDVLSHIFGGQWWLYYVLCAVVVELTIYATVSDLGSSKYQMVQHEQTTGSAYPLNLFWNYAARSIMRE